jgi:hypothetical protein
MLLHARQQRALPAALRRPRHVRCCCRCRVWGATCHASSAVAEQPVLCCELQQTLVLGLQLWQLLLQQLQGWGWEAEVQVDVT